MMPKTYPISVSMTPAYYDAEHMLLRTQLRCLSNQTNKDFDVWMIDPHYQKRKSIIPEFAEKFKLDIKHIPYSPNTRVAKIFDCAIFNAPYCYSKSEMIVRYSCYRFVRPNFIETIARAQKGINVDFAMFAIGPGLHEDKTTAAERVWNFESEEVHWDQVPPRSGFKDDTLKEVLDKSLELGNWYPFMDSDSGPELARIGMCGNIAWSRKDWFAINGTDEVFTNSSHWEDADFDFRAGMAGQIVMRKAHVMYRLHHHHGNFSQRSNVDVDVPFKKPCKICSQVIHKNLGDEDYGRRIEFAISAGKYEEMVREGIWVCKECLLSGAMYGAGGPMDYLNVVKNRGSKSNVLPSHMIGRNLNILRSRMDAVESLESKVEIYNDSWNNKEFYGS